MRKAAEIPPTDVSKALFMDLAFLLIAALVLLVQEPVEQLQEASLRSLPVAKIRSTAVKEVIEKDGIPGKSLYLQIEKDGKVREIRYDNVVIPIPKLVTRINEMPTKDKVIVLVSDQTTPYAEIAKVRDILSPMKDRGEITQIYEVVRKGQ